MTSLEAVQPQYSTCSQNRLSNRVKLRSASRSVGQYQSNFLFTFFRLLTERLFSILEALLTFAPHF